MQLKRLTVPLIILLVGIVLVAGTHAYFNILQMPAVKEMSFPFSVTYEINGKATTLSGTYTCAYFGQGYAPNPSMRYYQGLHDSQTPLLQIANICV